MVFAIVLAVLVLLAAAQAVRLAIKGDTQPLVLMIAGVVLLLVFGVLIYGGG